MDPASLSNLDPKLKETYERVMGGGATPPPTEPATPTPSDKTASLSAPQHAETLSTESTPLPSTPAEKATTEIPAPAEPLNTQLADPVTLPDQQPQTVTITQSLPNPTADNQIITPHGHSGLIKVFYIFGIIVFFIIYTVFWMKLQKFDLPF